MKCTVAAGGQCGEGCLRANTGVEKQKIQVFAESIALWIIVELFPKRYFAILLSYEATRSDTMRYDACSERPLASVVLPVAMPPQIRSFSSADFPVKDGRAYSTVAHPRGPVAGVTNKVQYPIFVKPLRTGCPGPSLMAAFSLSER